LILNLLAYILFGVSFFLSLQFKYIGIAFVYIYALMLIRMSKEEKMKSRFLNAFLTFFVFWLMMLNWLLVINVDLTILQRILIFFGWMFLSMLMGMVWSLPFAIASVKNNEVYFIPVIVSALEYFMSCTRDLSFLWVTPATAILDYPVLFQSADIGGSYLVSFIVIMFSVLLFKLFTAKNAVIYKIAIVILLFTVVLYGSFRIKNQYYGETIKVTIVQPNIPGEMKESYREFIEYRFKAIKENLEKAKTQEGEIVIFPETASPVYLTKRSKNEIKTYLIDFANENSKSILIGGLTYEYGSKNEEDRYYNSAFLIAPNETIQTYNKIRCVPFVERLPYEEKLRFLKKIDYGQGGYSVGKEQTVFKAGKSRFSAYICFESIFPTYVSTFAKNGAQFLVNISEDAWFVKGIGAYQHFQAGILRAVENRRYLVRVSNPGISGVIDPNGKIVASTKLNTAEVFTEDIVLNDSITFFTASGNILPKIFLLIMIFMIIFKLIRRHNGTAKTKNSA